MFDAHRDDTEFGLTFAYVQAFQPEAEAIRQQAMTDTQFYAMPRSCSPPQKERTPRRFLAAGMSVSTRRIPLSTALRCSLRHSIFVYFANP